MTLPLMRAAAGRRERRRWIAAALVLAAALGVGGVSGHADEPDLFTATVTVDATADSVVKAREAARLDGQRRALAAVAGHLAGGPPPAKMPKLDDNALTNLVASFEVANEKMSAVRYIADYTFHFRPDEVRRVLGTAGITAAGEAAKPTVVLPVFQSAGQPRLWEEPNPWREAWDRQSVAGGAQRLILPLGDAGDLAAVDAAKAQAGDPGGLAAIAKRNGSDDAIVALATPRGSADKPAGVDVTVRLYRAGKPLDQHFAQVAANPGESEADLLRRAAAAVVAEFQSGWKKQGVAGYDQEGSLTAVLPIASLDDWLKARDRLAAVAAIRKIALVALSRQEATIDISYLGTIDQLKVSLAGANLDLERGDPLWRLARSASGRTP